MINIEKFRSLDEIRSLRGQWEQLRGTSRYQTHSFNQYIDAISNDEKVISPLVIIVRQDDRIVAILPFAEYEMPRKFVLGELRIFSLSHRVLHATGAMLGRIDNEQAKWLIEDLAQLTAYDSVNLYEIPGEGSIYQSILANRSRLKVSPAMGDTFPHWVADFPDSYEAYLSGFKSKTRNSLKRKLSKFQLSCRPRLEVITETSQLEHYLSVGEDISRQTYQWDLGVRLENNAATRSRLSIIASEGELRCYLLYADGDPIVFMPGTLVGGVFHYGSPGFLRKYAHLSPGTVMLLLVFEDLIENTDCRCFDFGMGGDYSGYKAMFGNRHYEAAVLEIFPGKTIRSRLIHVLDWWFWGLKRVLKKIVSPGVKSAIKRGLRRIGLMK